MKKSAFPGWIFTAVIVIILYPTIAAWIPVIFFAWFVFKNLMPHKSPTGRLPKRRHPRENPYKKRYNERYHSGQSHSEPQSYRPKNYRYSIDNDDLDNPWQKEPKEEKQKAQTGQNKREYKAAPIKSSEKQNFLVYFIPILVGALTTSLSMQFGIGKILASILGFTLTIGLFVVMYLLRKKKVKEALDINGEIITDGRQKVTKITQIAEIVTKNPSIQWEIQEIARTVDELYDNFIEDPSDIDRARKFIKYNLPEAITLMEAYAKVSNNPNISGQEYEQIKKAEDAIIAIRESFQKLQQDLLANDLMDLEVQSRTLKSVLQNHLSFVNADKS